MRSVILTLSLAGLATSATAGGFSLRERSVHAQGASFAGSTAGAENVSYAGFNPAALQTVEHMEATFGLSLVAPDITGAARFNGQTSRPGVTGVVPSGALGYRVNEQFVVGLAFYSPFGLTTEYETDFIGAGDGVRSELITFAAAPMLAFSPTPSITLGVSVSAIYNDPQLTNISGFDPQTGASQESKLNATELEFAGALGAIWNITPETRIGFAYHTGYDITTNGILSTFDGSTPVDYSGVASISLPMTASVGIRHRLNEDWVVMGEFEWSNWSEFDRIRVDVPALAPDNDVGERTNYKDSYFVAIGAEYAWSDALTLRAGLAYDDTPTQLDGRSIRVPDADRVWVSAGLSYGISESFTLDAGYSVIFFEDERARLLGGPAEGTFVDFKGQTHILSIGGSMTF